LTNNYERIPDYVDPVCADLRTDSKYFLSKKNVRAMLLAGYSIGAFMIVAVMLVSYAIIFTTPLMNEEHAIYANVLFYASIWFGIFVLLPGIYCGMYDVLLKLSLGAKATITDLFKYYTSPRMFVRSIGIFVRSNWFLLGVGVMLIITALGSELARNASTETLKKEIEEIFGSAFILYLSVGFMIWGGFRKRIFIFLPYAVENPQVSLKQCFAASKRMNTAFFRKSFPNDFPVTFFWLLLSLLTVGILFVLHVGPMMMSKKINYYRSCMVNKFN
jgi:hypothetical protein